MSTTYGVILRDVQSGRYVDAVLTDRIDAAYAKHAEDAWIPFTALAQAQAVSAGKDVEMPEHSHWKWVEKVTEMEPLLACPTMGIECDGHIQGLMMLKTDGMFGKMREHAKKPLVYVNYLATAPWNNPNICPTPRFRGVGTVLMRAAIETSIDLEFKGRIGLHSLPGSEAWYKKLKMKYLGKDAKMQNLKYYEGTEAWAASFLA